MNPFSAAIIAIATAAVIGIKNIFLSFYAALLLSFFPSNTHVA
jgi:hypothetical protein